MTFPFARDKRTLLTLTAILLLALGVWWWLGSDENGPVSYQTAMVERGALKASITATGTLSALVTVQVGSQLSGQISALYVDFNSPVTKDQVIARIDPATFETRVTQAEAELAIAKANVAQAEASVSEARAVLEEARRTLARAEKLRVRGNVAQSQLDTAQAEVQKAEARLKAAEAQVITARAQVQQRQASLDSARVDLERTYIRSPVNGVVIDRTVDLGQTVAASLQAPVLFTIAQDLSDMQLEVSVDEADIGQIREGQEVIFTVDAYPERIFSGRVKQIRKAPKIDQNVVTYTVIVSAGNTDQTLLPGMTANVEIITAQAENVLKIPNQALHFRPRGERRARPDPARPPPSPLPTVWTLKDKKELVPHRVTLGVTDGMYSAVLSGDLKEGDEVVTGLRTGARSEAPARRRRIGFF